MNKPSQPTSCCPFTECPSNAQGVSPRVIAHSRLRTKNGWRRRQLCRRCGRTFTATTGTVYCRMRRPKADFDRVAQMQAEGMTKEGIARVLRATPSTIGRWLEKAALQASLFHESQSAVEEPVEFQVDELSCRGSGAAKDAWAYSGIEVWSRFWAALHVGNRTLRGTTLFLRQLLPSFQKRPFGILFTSDEFKYYEPVVRKIFGTSMVAYVQVKNRYSARGVVRSESRAVLGSPRAHEVAWERSEDSKRPNTAYVERLNLHKRMRCSLLRRRNAAPARKAVKVQEALELVRVFYNFVQRHSSLRFGREKRTPAMQAGIFSRPLTIREIFSWIAPPAERQRGEQWRLLVQRA